LWLGIYIRGLRTEVETTVDGLISLGLSLREYEEYLSRPQNHIDKETTLNEAIQFMLSHQITRVAVVDSKGYFLGVLDSLNILDALRKNFTLSPMTPIESFIREPELILYEEDDLEYNVKKILEHKLFSAFIINHKGFLQGELSLDYLSTVYQIRLKELEHFINQIIESVPNPIMAINTQGHIIFFNQAAEETLNLKVEEVKGQHIKNYFPDSLTFKALETGQELRDIRMRFGDRNLLTDFLPITLSGDKIIGAVAIFKDVTELEAVTSRLSTSEQLMATLEAVVENSYEGMVVIDNQERIILMNQFFLDVLELKSQDVIGKYISDISPDSHLPQTLKTGLAQFGETWHLGGRDFIIMRVPIEREGKIVGAIGKTLFKNMEIAKIFAKKVMKLEEDLAYYKEELGRFHASRFAFDDIIGESPAMKEAKSLAERAAKTSSTVLILGESGTGKEVFSHAIHESSLRSKGPFIKINCAALPENLLESELFGYAEGAFTGARKGGKPGKFELADKGTIFLDEIGDMTLTMQAKLLRVLQEREVERLGGTQPTKVDVRIIAATNRDLHQMVMEHKFRLDLYYRLNVLTIELPPLRERREDITSISKAIIRKINHRLGMTIDGLTSESLSVLFAYDWPGNIRELENIIERAMVTCDETWIHPKHLSLSGNLEHHLQANDTTLEIALAEAEREIIQGALRRAQGNKVHAAKILGIHRSVLYKKLAKYNLENIV
jgi:PAS domain S-box-containing protein